MNFISSSTAINLNEDKKIISIKQLIDKKAKYVQCSGPKKSWDLTDIKYDRLIIATGLRPRKIHPNGLTVYDANDVEKFDFKEKNVCVIGGSFLAIETATNLGKTLEFDLFCPILNHMTNLMTWLSRDKSARVLKRAQMPLKDLKRRLIT